MVYVELDDSVCSLIKVGWCLAIGLWLILLTLSTTVIMLYYFVNNKFKRTDFSWSLASKLAEFLFYYVWLKMEVRSVVWCLANICELNEWRYLIRNWSSLALSSMYLKLFFKLDSLNLCFDCNYLNIYIVVRKSII